MSITVATAQFAAGTDKEENLTQIRTLIADAATADARLVILPENSMYSSANASDVEKSKAAETLTGHFVSELTEFAHEFGVDVVAGMTEICDTDTRSFNTLVHVTSDGQLNGVYRKIHLYDAFGYRESDTVIAADHAAPLIFDLDGVRFGAITCYDLRFPEIARCLIDAGADAIILPAAWVAGPMKETHWEILLRARAIENTAYVVGVGQTGPTCTGLSMTVDPMGVVISNGAEAIGLGVATIDAARVAQVRKANPSLSNRRFTVTPAA
ncbi:carbon-nitrogen hydrolase family protein [Spelaeicoccus albus]|uniref:Putative amidohydrolase n=1 Tax=Spelaeicoccus albus TaxID=1280376 RepID=A0A7Z0D4K5_9MICO|nr:carbon-nitrogen hydrolase family protein [Spelaeicoccus albus]NYI68774.1 putative amidohydrolase [Spelaeicoccus albus]